MNSFKFNCVAFLTIYLLTCSNCSSSDSDTSYLDSKTYDVPSDDGTSQNNSEPIPDEASIKIPYTEQSGNTITIPVKINGMTLDMIYDTGASTTLITLAEARYLFEKGNLSEEDFIDFQKYRIANGEITVGLRVNLRNVVIGDKISLRNIEAAIVENQQAPLLLGQSVMKRFREISVDRENKVVKFFE